MKIENNNEKLTLKDYVFGAIIMLGLLLYIASIFYGVLYGIDRTIAMHDNEKGIRAENCLFQSNCDYYNERLY